MWVLVVFEVFVTNYWIVVRMPSHAMAGVEQYIRSVYSSLFYHIEYQYGKERTNSRSWKHLIMGK